MILNLSNKNQVEAQVDDIIIYKEDNGVVYGYFNQKALDTIIFNHKLMQQWGEEKDVYGNVLRNSVIYDISRIRHSITEKPNSDGDYISKGDILFTIGLDYLDVGHYCRENKVSEFGLYHKERLFSLYSGYYSNKIDDIIVSSDINSCNSIKDGDLLFTIELATKPKEDVICEDIKFTYNMLSRDFLESIPSLSDITIKRWLVNDYSKVNVGDDILEITEFTKFSEPRFSTILKSPSSGLLIQRYEYNGYTKKLRKGDNLFSVYPDEARLKDDYPNEIIVTTDEFTKAKTIKGVKCGGNVLGFNLGNIFINFENTGEKNYLLLRYNRKDANLNKKCTLHLLLGDDTIITLNAVANPVKVYGNDNEAKYQLSTEDLIKLKKEKFLKWQITNEEGITIKTGNNICCLDANDTTGITQNLSYEVFQNFIADFYKQVKENTSSIESNIQESANKEKDKIRDSCYVYLMIDTTNNFYKIGISNNPKYREHTLQSDKPTIELICAREYPTRAIAEAIEASLHKVYASKRIRGEWFNLEVSDINDIKNVLQ